MNTSTAIAVRELLKSEAESRIYLYLLKTNGAKTEDIIKGTKLHPSTVRELLSKMYSQRLIHRQKQRNDNIGKNPYLYTASPPRMLLKRYIEDLEQKLNKIANIGIENNTTPNHYIHILYHDEGGKP